MRGVARDEGDRRGNGQERVDEEAARVERQ